MPSINFVRPRWMYPALLIVGVVATVAVFVPAALASGSDDELEVIVTRAPVTGDGTTAGAPTEIVLSFVDPDPDVDGIEIKAGGTIAVTLPSEFVAVALADPLTVVLQGWPQSPPDPPGSFRWTTTVDQNTITATMDEDFLPGVAGPGPKQFHLEAGSFLNPNPGTYSIELTIRPDPATDATLHGSGTVRVIPVAQPAVSAMGLFSGAGPPPPFPNVVYQTVVLGESGLQVGLYIWDARREPFLDVDVQMTNSSHGRLVQGGKTVGAVSIDAPSGASAHTLTTVGPSTLDSAFLTGQEVGLLLTLFTPDPEVGGQYAVTFSMNGGDSQTLRYEVGTP